MTVAGEGTGRFLWCDVAVLLRHRLTRNRVNRALLRALVPRPSGGGGLVRLGSGNGAWWTPTDLLKPAAVCYCAGAGIDVSLDLALANDYGCQVWTFDPTPLSIDYVTGLPTPDNLHFEPIGLWTEDTTLHFESEGGSHSATRSGVPTLNPFDGPVESLPTIMGRLGHDRIDLLKLDIEGAEGPVLEHMLTAGIRPGALLIELDQPEPAWRTARLVRRLLAASYELQRVELWNFTFTLR